jgi:tetratricopeptide (TPR) repeat protein
MPKLRAACLRNLGIVAYARGAYDDAQTYQLMALNISRDLGDRRGESSALNNLGQIAREQNNLTAARDFQAQALRLSRETGDRQLENSALNLAQAAMKRQDMEQKREFQQEALLLSREIGNRRGECTALTQLGELALEMGVYDEAQQHLDEALEIARAVGLRRGELKVLTALGRLHYAREAYQAALEAAREAIAGAEASGARPELAAARALAGSILLRLDDTNGANDAYTHALDLWRAQNQPRLALIALSGLANTSMARDDLSSALAIVEDILSNLSESESENLDDTLHIYLTCFRVLRACKDPRAAALLDQGYQLMQSHSIAPTPKHQPGETPAIHRELSAAWAFSHQH